MALSRRTESDHRETGIPAGRAVAPVPVTSPAAPDQGYRPGGQVGLMQDDLARRLAGIEAVHLGAESEGERRLRIASMVAGYGALAACYAGVGMILLR